MMEHANLFHVSVYTALGKTEASASHETSLTSLRTLGSL